MKREEQRELPGFEISREFVLATEAIIKIANDLNKIEALVKSGVLDKEERECLADLWENLTAVYRFDTGSGKFIGKLNA